MFRSVGKFSRPTSGLALVLVMIVVLSACAAPASSPAQAPAAAAGTPTAEAGMTPQATMAVTSTQPTAAAAGATSATPSASGQTTGTVTIPTVQPSDALKGKTVALVVGVKDDAFYVTMQRGASAEAQRLGLTFVTDGPAQFNAVQQTPIIDAMIAKKVDALLVAATDKQAMIQPLKRVADAGIPVISVDTFIGDGNYTSGPVTFPLSYVGSDNTQGGMIACQALIQSIGGKGSIYIQNVNPGISTTDQREQGCKDAINATNGAVTLAGVDYNGDSAATSAQQTAAVLQRNPQLSAIFGANLFSAEGAAQAVKNAGLTGTVKIANFDAPESAIQDLRNKVVDIVIAQKPADIGKDAVDLAALALEGKTTDIPKRVPTGYVVITRDNVDSPEAQASIYKSK